MKKINSLIATCAAAVVLSSCGGVGLMDYVNCFLNPGEYTTNECIIGKTMDAAANSLVEYIGGVDTLEEAESLASKMDVLLTAVEAARGLKIEIPAKAKNAYNDALYRIQKHDYFNSEPLRAALSTARPL